MPGTCLNCKEEGATSLCGRCRFAYYCSSNCQRIGWKMHKKECSRLHQIRIAVVKICTLIASHISYDGQVNYLHRCIHSLLDQIIPTDIIVSISYEAKYKGQLDEALRIYADKDIKFKVCKERKYQMEHVYNLLEDAMQYDLITFCDDDDTYHPRRIGEFREAYSNVTRQMKSGTIPSNKIFGGIREQREPRIINKENSNVTGNVPCDEFWCYGVVPGVLALFFDRMKNNMDLLQFKFGDMYFREFLRRLNRSYIWGELQYNPKSILYRYNAQNPNSIIGKGRNMKVTSPSHPGFRDNLILSSIAQDKRSFNEMKHGFRLNNKKIKKIFPERERIKKLLLTLYDMHYGRKFI